MNHLFIPGKRFVLVALSFDPIFYWHKERYACSARMFLFTSFHFFSVSLLQMAENPRL